MPTYVYEHQLSKECNLGNQFEKFEPISSTPLTSCEICKTPVKRIISNGAGIIFKGKDFYETSYKNKK